MKYLLIDRLNKQTSGEIKKTIVFTGRTILLSQHSVRKRTNRWKMNDNFENKQNHIFFND